MSRKAGLNAYFEMVNLPYNGKNAHDELMLNLIVDQANSFDERVKLDECTRAFVNLALKTIDYLLENGIHEQPMKQLTTNGDYLIQDFLYTRKIRKSCGDDTYNHYSHYMRNISRGEATVEPKQILPPNPTINSSIVKPILPEILKLIYPTQAKPSLAPVLKRMSPGEPELAPEQKRECLEDNPDDVLNSVADEKDDTDTEWLPETELDVYISNTDSSTELESNELTDITTNTPVVRKKRMRKHIVAPNRTSKVSPRLVGTGNIMQTPIKPYEPLPF